MSYSTLIVVKLMFKSAIRFLHHAHTHLVISKVIIRSAIVVKLLFKSMMRLMSYAHTLTGTTILYLVMIKHFIQFKRTKPLWLKLLFKSAIHLLHYANIQPLLLNCCLNQRCIMHIHSPLQQ